MKTTVKLKLRALRRMPGHGTLLLHVTRHRATRIMTTPYVLSIDEWDSKKQSIIMEHVASRRKKELLSIKGKLKKYMQELGRTVEIMESRGDYSSRELLQFFRQRNEGQQFCLYVFGRAESFHQQIRFGTAHVYRYAAVSFLKFLGGKDIRINKINTVLIEDYERHLLSEKKSKNTVSCYMRSLRAAYNQAVREKVFAVKKARDNPFSGVFTGNAKTRKRAIDSESILKLAKQEIPCRDGACHVSKNEAHLIKDGACHVFENGAHPIKDAACHVSTGNSLTFCRDLFLFSFYTQGMSFSDMVNLKKGNIRDKFILYNRKKTGQQIIVELEDCMKEVIERYADSDSDFIFPVLRGFKDYEEYGKWKKSNTALSAYNKNLKKLGALAGVDGNLTSYVSRHSWATIASQEGIPIATISRGMGHEYESTTRIYISQADYSDVGRANRQILAKIYPLNP